MSPVLNEMDMLCELKDKTLLSRHPGKDHTRLPYSIFDIESNTGRHYCFASKAQGVSLQYLREKWPETTFPRSIIRSLISGVLLAIDFLHSDGGVAHTGALLRPYEG